ncbi:MAG: PAS domain S-box protein [Fulvivirga sp.]
MLNAVITISSEVALAIGVLLLLVLLVGYFVIRQLKSKAQLKQSQLQRAFNKLKDREAALSIIYENAHDFIALLKPYEDDFKIVRLPQRFLKDIEKHYTISANRIVGNSIKTLYEILGLSEKQIKYRYENFAIVKERLASFKYEEEYVKPGGKRGIAQSSLIPITSKNKCEFILYVSQDISDERESAIKLERAANLFKGLVEHNPAAILLFNANGIIEMSNSKFYEYSGFTEKEIIGKDASLIVPPKHYPLLQKVRKEIAENPKVYNFGREEKLTALRKNGSEYNCELMISPVSINNETFVIVTILDVTFYHETQQNLKDSNAKLQSLIGNLPGMVYRVQGEPPYSVKFVSEQSKDIVGLTPEQIMKIDITPKDLIEEDFHEELRNKVANALETGVGQELEIRSKAKYGKKWLIDRFKPVKLADGKTYLEGLLIDVTDRRENEQRLVTATEGAQLGMWEWDLQTDKVTVNSYQTEMIGFRLEEVENTFEWWANRIHPKDVDVVYEPMINHVKGGSEMFETEYRVQAKNGAYKWILVRGKVLERDKDGRAIRALGVHLNIDNRKTAEIQLVKSQQRLEALISNLPGMVYRSSVNNSFAVSFASDGVAKLTGYPVKDFIDGKVSIFKLMKDSYKARIKQQVDEAIAKKEPFTLIYEIETKNNGTKHLLDKGQELEDGQIEGIISDITERVEAEDKLIQTIIETEDRERQRIARELHDNLGQKLTTASLNFNALKSDVEDDQLKSKILKGIGYLTQAIDDAREISHNLMPRSMEDFGFVLAVESIVNDINRLSKTKFEFYHNIKTEQIDDHIGIHLYRITQELINNALKYANASNVILQFMQYDDVLIWSIEDDGVGFDKTEIMQKQHFGLDSVRHRVQILSGNIEINSQPGRGTSVTIELPMQKQHLHEQD